MKRFAKKSFGQNFLVDKRVIKKMLLAAELKPGEQVLEIGPGTGAITEALLEQGVKLTAVEADSDLIDDLKVKFSDIDLLHSDILKAQISFIDFGYKVVANLPYNIASRVLRKFLSTKPRPSRMVVMIQREVAQRIVAKPPHSGLLSVAAQLYAKCKIISKVSPLAFSPKPKVESAIVAIDVYNFKEEGKWEDVLSLAKVGFSSKRKQLQRNFLDHKISSKTKIERIFEQNGLNLKIRAENLTPEDWINLHQAFAASDQSEN